MTIKVNLLTDVVNNGNRLTIMEATFHRFVLAEVNTHRSHSRSSASSRAIPVEKMLQRAIMNAAMPVVWASEQPGMQGGDELEGQDRDDAINLLEQIAEFTTTSISEYLEAHPEKKTRLHKSLLNRPMEWFQYHTIIFGATNDGWDNFFAQRATKFSPMAQPELRAVVDQMLDIYECSQPAFIRTDEWVTPYVNPMGEALTASQARKVSAARCARVSYLNHDGVPDVPGDLALFDKLIAARPMHAAPLEFVCRPMRSGEEQIGNFKGYRQFRHIVERGVLL